MIICKNWSKNDTLFNQLTAPLNTTERNLPSRRFNEAFRHIFEIITL